MPKTETLELDGETFTVIRFAHMTEICARGLHLFSLNAFATEGEIRAGLIGFIAGGEAVEASLDAAQRLEEAA